MNLHANEIINLLELMPHPEGGYYKEIFRSEESTINKNGASRNVCTSIYYLLENKDKSHFHRIQSDELWYFHLGQSLEILFFENGTLKRVTLGNNISSGEFLYYKIPAHTWFACKIKNETGFSLVSCVVAPGFDFADFELASEEQLCREYPQHKAIIEEFTFN